MREIGDRIALLRKVKGLSQEQMVEALALVGVKIGRNRLSEIENGKRNDIDFSFLKACSKMFDCDVGFLLCEYGECKTADWQAINNATGLSEKSIGRLSTWMQEENGEKYIAILNYMLNDPRFFASLMGSMSEYLEKAVYFEELRERYHRDGTIRQTCSHGDITEEIRLQNECEGLVTRKDVNYAEAVKAVAFLRVNEAFKGVIDSLEHTYKLIASEI